MIAHIKKLKSEKKAQQEKLEQLNKNESMIEKETMTNPTRIEKSLDEKIKTLEKGTNTYPIELLSTNKSKSITS